MTIPDMQIKAITFDWGDTLAANHSMPYRASQRRGFDSLAQALSGAGYEIPDNWVEDCFDELYQAWDWCMDAKSNPEHQEIDLDRLMHGWIERIGKDIDPDTKQQAIAECLYHLTNVVVPFQGAVDTLRQLKSAGYRIGILSHVAWQRSGCEAWFERHGFAEHIDFYSLSSDVGWIKPNIKHYQDTVDQAGCAPGEILHVGDHPERDILGAKAFGMRTCLKLTQGIYEQNALENCAPDYNVLHVKELLSVLPIN